MEPTSLFPDDPSFLTELGKLNSLDDKKCVEMFRSLANQIVEKEQEMCPGIEVNSTESSTDLVLQNDTLYTILDRVAFYPLKPGVMEAELVRLGVNRALASSLSSVWATVAKNVVTKRRKVDTNVKRIQYQVLKTIPNLEESVIFHLQLDSGKKLAIRFKPEQLLQFYDKMELIQANIDNICQ